MQCVIPVIKGSRFEAEERERERGGEVKSQDKLTNLLGETPERYEKFCHNKRATGAGLQT